jgi:pimeloyl-ACP methyl ester carboxylesterase
MKTTILSFALFIAATFNLNAGISGIQGPQGNISYKVTLPDGFNPETDSCPVVILMHGIFSSKDYNPMPAIARGLAKAGIASIRFDFNGHGKSEGKLQEMTVEKEIADAMAVYQYVKTLPYVSKIGFLGHSQGGVIASMTAGRLAAQGLEEPARMVLLAPGAVIKEACQAGTFFNARFDPANPPEYIKCWGFKKLGYEYLTTTQLLDIYGTASAYKGPVLILHGTKDTIVPMWCSERYKDIYGEKANLSVVDGENHTINRRRGEVVRQVVDFFKAL